MLLNLILWEKENGFKAKYVAEKLELTESSYSRMKSGKQTITTDLVFKFNAEFGHTVEDGNVLKLFEKK